MRNVLVVLVLSCIGLSCGFIVPSGIREIIEDLNKSANYIQNSDSKPRNMIKSKTLNTTSADPILTAELLTNPIEKQNNSSNNSLANDLYENSNGKEANIEERSFIYIKQRARIPYLKNVFELIPKNNFINKGTNSYVLSHPILDDISRRFITENVNNKYFNTRIGQPYQDKYQSKINNFINYYVDTERNHQTEKDTKQQGKYFEVIKVPLPRPITKTNENDFISMENSLFNFTIGRKLLADIQKSLSNKSAIKLNTVEQLVNKITEKKYAKTVTVSDEIIDASLDQTVKRVLDNQILGSKSNHIDHNGFHFCRDCLKKLQKQTLNSGLQFEPTCKCGRKGLMKRIGDDIFN